MCFLNPKWQRKFELKVCTAHGTKEDFNKAVGAKLLQLVKLEKELNASGELRWHITEVTLPPD